MYNSTFVITTVSIIIPVYNVSPYIEACLKSVMRQTYGGKMECIIVDDCGTDDSIAIAERMTAAYHGSICFRIVHHQQNRGLSAARNTGIKAATGEYVIFIDSDDEISCDCIEKLMAPIHRDSSVEMVMGRGVRVQSDGYQEPASQSVKREDRDLTSHEAVRSWFFGGKATVLSAWNKLIKKEFLIRSGLTFKEGIIWEDTLWTFYIMKYLSHLYVIEDITYFYHRRPGSITTGTDDKTKWFYWGVVYHEISNNFTSGESDREARLYVRAFCRHYIYCGHDELYKETARNFRRELSPVKDASKYLRLVTTGILSKTSPGRKVYHAMRRIYKVFTARK